MSSEWPSARSRRSHAPTSQRTRVFVPNVQGTGDGFERWTAQSWRQCTRAHLPPHGVPHGALQLVCCSALHSESASGYPACAQASPMSSSRMPDTSRHRWFVPSMSSPRGKRQRCWSMTDCTFEPECSASLTHAAVVFAATPLRILWCRQRMGRSSCWSCRTNRPDRRSSAFMQRASMASSFQHRAACSSHSGTARLSSALLRPHCMRSTIRPDSPHLGADQ
jgi:hypothetical protein